MSTKPSDEVAAFEDASADAEGRGASSSHAESPAGDAAESDAEGPVEAAPPEAATPAAAGPSKWKLRAAKARALRDWIRDTYCVMDPRTAGLFRIVLGFLCAANAIRHWTVARWFYSNSGVLTNHYVLFRPFSNANFSVFSAFSSLGEVSVAFGLQVLFGVLLMIGWRPRLFAFLSFVWQTSLDNRLVMVENGGYVVVNLVIGYAMFLPIERRFSVDAWLRSWRERRERTVAELDVHPTPSWAASPYVSFGVLLLFLNLTAVYFFNVVNKGGQIWRSGHTVHYVLYINRMVTGLAVLLRELLPNWTTYPLSWGTLMLEALICAWIAAPAGRRYTRLLAMAGMWALHGTFGLMMRLGPFSWFMICWSFVLPAAEQWEMAERWARRRASPRVVLLDPGSPLAFTLARILARLDRLDLLRFEDATTAPAPLLAARDPETGEVATGGAAIRAIAGALPGGRYGVRVLSALLLGQLDRVAELLDARRDGIARFFGLQRPPSAPRRSDLTAEPSPLGRWLRGKAVLSRELFLGYMGVCFLLQALIENKSVPPQVKPTMPSVMEATINYPRLYQGWGMFAPNPITDDGTVAIDAWTVSGRHVDPFTGKEPDLDLTDARGLGLPQIWQDYFNRIRLDRNRHYRQGLRDYLLRWHLETGRPEDEIVAFDVYWVRDKCPKVGERTPYENETVALLTYRKSGFKPPPGFPVIPPEPQVQSADPVEPKDAKDGKDKAAAAASATPSAVPSASPAPDGK